MRMRVMAWLAMAWAGSALAQPGQDVGNGGDLIQCRPSTENPFAGTLSLDYVLTYQEDELSAPPTLDASLDRISRLLLEKVPTLHESFRKFRASLFNASNPSFPYLWIPVADGLVNVHDEDLNAAERVPDNCRDGDLIPLAQAVIRQDPAVTGAGSVVIHKYMANALKKLAAESPLQASFLLVHEWLWNLSDNVHRNRMIDRFLHSAALEAMSAEETQAFLKELGLHVPPVLPEDLFDTEHCRVFYAGVDGEIRDRITEYAEEHELPTTVPLALGDFVLKAASQQCDLGTGSCSGWAESDFWERKLGLQRRVATAGYEVASWGNNPFRMLISPYDGKVHELAKCAIGATGDIGCPWLVAPGSHGKFMTVEDRPTTNISLRGWTDGRCAHLRFSSHGGTVGNIRTDWKFALFFWLGH
jgi:hypothetical protein